MQLAQIFLHRLTLQLLHSKLEQLLNRQKIRRYRDINIIKIHLDSCHFFTPVAVEMSGVFGVRTTDFLKELGHRLRQGSGIKATQARRLVERWGGWRKQ